MSTIKTDAITAVTTNGDLSLDGIGTGGVSIASTLKMAKGGDISSASPLVIDTDGNYFDVTGTTNFAAMTVEAGNFFMLQFDGALTITHGSGIELPGAANLTTATGDRLMCYATAANTVVVMSVETEAAAAAAGFTQSSVTATTSGTNHTISGIASGAKLIYFIINGVSTSGNDNYDITIGDSGGLETAGYTSTSQESNTAVTLNTGAGGTGSKWELYNANGTDNYAVIGVGVIHLVDPSTFLYHFTYQGGRGRGLTLVSMTGDKTLSAEITQIDIAGGTFDAGKICIMYI